MKREHYDIGLVTDQGNKRSNNQDSLLVRTGKAGRQEFALLAVADGMGGLANGEQASHTAVALLDRWYAEQLPALLSQSPFSWNAVSGSLSVVVEQIDWSIREQNAARGNRSGTTLVLLFLLGGRFLFKHIGDSRIYLLRDGMVVQMTRDQTWCQQEVDAGRLTAEEALRHQMRHYLTSALGVGEDYRCQEGQGTVLPGDRFLLCSDGFYNELELTAPVLSQGRASAQKVLDGLLERIKAGPADDNISAVLASVSGRVK